MCWLFSWKHWYLPASPVNTPALLSDSADLPSDKLQGIKSHILRLAKKFRLQ